MRNRLLVLTAVATLLAAGGCTVSQQTAPGASGPSEFALSLKMAVSPDRLVQDGAQSARVNVTAFDAAGKVIPVAVHLDALASIGGVTQSFGTFSSSTFLTGTDANSPATVIYYPPASTSGTGATVTIRGSIIASDAVTGSTQQVVLLVTPAVTGVVASAPYPSMTVTPAAFAGSLPIGRPITFDGSGSCGSQLVFGVCPGSSAIVTSIWNFGDGTPSVSGTSVSHVYTAAGTYTAQLTITNDRGLIGTTTQTFLLTAVAAPVASFVTSPTTVKAATTVVNFDSSKSTAAVGRSIVSYSWNFGDGTTGTGASPTKPASPAGGPAGTYSPANTYVVSLTVTDDIGQTNTVTVNVAVTP